MCCEVFCSLWRSARYCCLCIRVRKGVYLIHFLDLIEVVINGALLYFYLTIRNSMTLVPFTLLLYGNLVPLFFRIGGLCLRVCGALRLWTRGAVFCSRLWSIIFMLFILMFQAMVTFYILHERVDDVRAIPLFGKSLENRLTTEAIEGTKNYDKLGYGLCTFCDPDGGCQSEFEAYKLNGNNDNTFSFIADIFGTDQDNFTSLEDYAHQGLSLNQCTTLSLLSLLPYLYWILYQIHFTLVVKSHWDVGQDQAKVKHVRAWQAANNIMTSAGLDFGDRSPDKFAFQRHNNISEIALQVHSLDDESWPDTSLRGNLGSSNQETRQESSGRQLLPPARGAQPFMGSDNNPGLASAAYNSLRNTSAPRTRRPQFTTSLQSYVTHGTLIAPQSTTHRKSLLQVPSQGSIELATNYSSMQQSQMATQIMNRKSALVASTSTMRTLTPMDVMGKSTAEKWFQKNTRVFNKIVEDDDEIPFYEVNKRRNATIDHDDEEAQVCAICQVQIKNQDMVIELRCQHLYHKECAQSWVLEKKKCPTCRKRQFASPDGGPKRQGPPPHEADN